MRLTPFQAQQIADFHQDNGDGIHYVVADVVLDIVLEQMAVRLEAEAARLRRMKSGREIPPLADRSVQVAPDAGPWVAR